ncbi:MAG TPA: nicotinamide riboside transporter PnuC [Bacteroidales bacterium]|nr:nicotinamide riboside transporter PnuC [Bacteroidales bacterium]
MPEWLAEHSIEIFGAIAGILYVFLEIRQNILLWPLGIITSAVYIFVFRENGFYAGMVLQLYYLVISVYGWRVWWHGARSMGQRAESMEQKPGLAVRRIGLKTGVICLAVSLALWGGLWYVLDRWTDSPVPLWDGLITSLSVVATWMLTHKILEQWHVWIIANSLAVVVYLVVGMYPTTVLFFVYAVMAVVGLREWRKSPVENN